ncbi:MAG: PLP-dependent transferase, partial [Sphaerochaetaceae bacterium]|nr:PLP-dependent transferase [Sphaerochaetaceae bacterium]
MSGGSGLLSVRLKSSNRDKIEQAVDAMKMFRLGVSWGGYESLVFPTIATKEGDPSILRLHIGLEHTQTILEDLDHAFSLLKETV